MDVHVTKYHTGGNMVDIYDSPFSHTSVKLYFFYSVHIL